MSGNPPVLVLPGTFGVADGGRSASIFGRDRRVVTVAYGKEKQIGALLDRAVLMMNDTSADLFDVVGFSIGGWFAQCLAAREPLRVRKLVLAHSFTLSRSSGWRFALATSLWPIIPAPILKAGFLKRARMALASLKTADPELYASTLRSLANTMNSPDFLPRILALQHAARDSVPEMRDCVPRQQMLIIDSDDDLLIGKRSRQALCQKFPAAERIILRGAGHASALSTPDELASAVETFLAGGAAGLCPDIPLS